MEEKEFLNKIPVHNKNEKQLIENSLWLLDNLDYTPTHIGINFDNQLIIFTFTVDAEHISDSKVYDTIEITRASFYYCQYKQKPNRRIPSLVLQKYYSFLPGRYLPKKEIFFLNKEMEFFRMDN